MKVTEVAAPTESAVTVKVVELEPAGTATLDGTVATAVFELVSVTVAPPVGAAAVSVTVPVAVCPLPMGVGTLTLLRADAAALTVTLNVDFTPEYDAVNVTDVALVTVVPLIVNVVEVEPAGIVTLGKLTSAGEALSPIAAPPLGAGPVRATVQVEVAGGVNDKGLQENPFNPGGVIVTVAPVAATASDEPVASEASPLVSWSAADESVVELETTSASVATVPVARVVAFWPDSTQVNEPAVVELHWSDLFAAVPAAPAANVAELKSVVE